MHYSDEILVKRTLSGDKQAFDSLVVRYNKEIYKLILSWTKDPEDAQELTQEAFVTAYKELYSLHQPKKFYPWLRQMSIHLCQNWKRKNNIVYLPLDENMLSEEPSPEEALILKETLTKTMEAIDKLPKLDAELIKEYLEGTSYQELQKKYNISTNALAVRLARIRHRVRSQIKEFSVIFSVLSYEKFKRVFIKGIAFGVIEGMKMSLAKSVIIWGTIGVLVIGGSSFLLLDHWKPIKISSSKNDTQEVLSTDRSPDSMKKKLSNIDEPLVRDSHDLISNKKREEKEEKILMMKGKTGSLGDEAPYTQNHEIPRNGSTDTETSNVLEQEGVISLEEAKRSEEEAIRFRKAMDEIEEFEKREKVEELTEETVKLLKSINGHGRIKDFEDLITQLENYKQQGENIEESLIARWKYILSEIYRIYEKYGLQ
ncbi:MAG: RNA polymerase sigma factor [bacterium]